MKLAPPSPRSGYRLPVGNHPGNTGGKPGRSGPKPAAWKARCAEALENADALPVLEKMIAGEILEKLGTTKDGEDIIGETKNKDRLGAIDFLAKYAHGLPVQKVGGEMRHLLIVGSADEMTAAMLPADDAPDELDVV